MSEFRVTAEHIALLRRMYWDWNDCEFGAPMVDPKRPYGNSTPVSDMAEILNVPTDKTLDHAARQRLCKLHRETMKVLEIAISSGRLEPGLYSHTALEPSWKRVEEQATANGGS